MDKFPTIHSPGRLIRIFSFIALVAGSSHSWALGVEPMVFDVGTSGTRASISMQIRNDDPVTMTVELSALHLTIADDGKEVLTPAEEDILIFPPIAAIPGGGTQVVQIQYVGEPELETSKAYRVAVEQLPVALKGNKGVGIAANFYTLMNVVPEGSTAALTVQKIALGADGKTWQLQIENTGNRFARLSQTDWTLKSATESVELGRANIAKSTDANLILPNTSRQVMFVPPDNFEPEDVEISISVKR